MRIVTNNQPRPIVYWHELTQKEKQEFDYLTEDNMEMFFRYKGWVYSLSDFIRDGTPEEWDGSMGQSYFDAVLVKIIDSESIIVGHAFW